MCNAFNLNENDNFSKLRGIDLQELLLEIDEYLLEYRKKLNLSSDLTFGAEIEFEKIDRYIVEDYLHKNYDKWKCIYDSSLELGGGEVVSPIMTDSKKYWDDLWIICKYLTENNADTSHNAGGHIHIGSILGDDLTSWKQFIKLYTAYENVLFRFSYGDKLQGRTKINRYAAPISDFLHIKLNYINNISDIKELIKFIRIMGKYYSVNFLNVEYNKPFATFGNTLEFRSPNGSTNAIIWQNNINTFAKMLLSAKEKVMNEDFLDYKLKNEFISYSDKQILYSIINLKNALEFVDLVFDNNLDKIYFLKQYLKSFQEVCDFNDKKKIKTFTR